jgi:hypothetical protein
MEADKTVKVGTRLRARPGASLSRGMAIRYRAWPLVPMASALSWGVVPTSVRPRTRLRGPHFGTDPFHLDWSHFSRSRTDAHGIPGASAARNCVGVSVLSARLSSA